MPFNLLRTYNTQLDIAGMDERQRNTSLRGVFARDFENGQRISFQGKAITPTPADGRITMDTLFAHLTTQMVDKVSRRREFHMDRSCRLHWVRFHIDLRVPGNLLIFSVAEPEGNRTYIYDQSENYVVVLEPLRKAQAYYLLSAYPVTGKDAQRNKMIKKYQRRLPHVL